MNTLVGAVRRALDGPWGHVRDEVRSGLDPDLVAPLDDDLPVEEQRARTLQKLLELARHDYPARGFTEAQGGLGDPGGSVTAFEMIGHGDLSLFVKAGVQFGLFGGAVANLGTSRQHAALLPSILDGSLLGCFAMTETGHGSDVQSLETTATYDPATDELVVDSPTDAARKDYIGNAARDGRMAAVFAQLVVDGEGHGIHCVLVPVRDADGGSLPGVAVGDCGAKAGLRGVDNGRLAFDGVRVPRSNLLGRYGSIDEDGAYHSPIDRPDRRFFTMLGTLVRGRVSVAGGAGAATRTALVLATRYALDRRQFRTPGGDEEILLLDYRSHQRKLLPAIAHSYALMFVQNRLVERMHDVQPGRGDVDGHAQRELEARAAGIKAVTTAHATATIQTCREACGGAGYLSVNRMPGLKADTDVFTTFEGDNTVLLQLVAKGMLTNYAAAFHELDTLGTIAFAAGRYAGTVIEHTVGGSIIQRLIAGAPGRDAPHALEDRGGQLALFEDRERHLTETLADRLRRSDDDGDPLGTLNDTQDHLLTAAEAHIDSIVLEAFVAGIEECDDDGAGALLGQVCDLHVLSTVERHRAWYLEHGRLSQAQAKGVVASVNRLCAELRPHARTLVDAFGIPDSWLTTEMPPEQHPVEV